MDLHDLKLNDLPAGYSEAIKIGSTHYFTREPCCRGHVAPRYTSTKGCVICHKENSRKFNNSNPRPPKEKFFKKACEIIKSRGGTCISTSKNYVNAKTLLKIKCSISKHPLFQVSYDNLKHGRWCRECKADKQRGNFKYTIEDMHRIAKDRGGHCLSKNFLGVKRKLKWKCSNENHSIFYSTSDTVINNETWCPVCGEEKKGRELRPVQDVLEIILKHGGKLICFIDEYKGYKTKAKIRCSDGHIWTTTVHVLLKGCWCPKCRDSFGEQVTRNIFEATFGVLFPKIRPDFLVTKAGGRLELDGYNKDMKLAFEYQGPYHQRPDQIKRDNIKRQICYKRGIKLIEIPYAENPHPPENVLKIVAAEIQNIFPNKTAIFRNEVHFKKNIEELREIIAKKGGTLISDCYRGYQNKLKVKCSDSGHPVMEITPESLRNGHYCQYCSKKAGLEKRASRTMEQLQEFGKEVGLALISKNYRGVRGKYKWNCKNGHLLKRTKPLIAKSIKRGKNPCTICAGTHKQLNVP